VEKAVLYQGKSGYRYKRLLMGGLRTMENLFLEGKQTQIEEEHLWQNRKEWRRLCYNRTHNDRNING
jgi:hypothetical protein